MFESDLTILHKKIVGKIVHRSIPNSKEYRQGIVTDLYEREKGKFDAIVLWDEDEFFFTDIKTGKRNYVFEAVTSLPVFYGNSHFMITGITKILDAIPESR